MDIAEGCDGQVPSDGGDRIWRVSLGSDRAIRRVDEVRERQVPGGFWFWSALRGNRLPLGDEESISGDAEACMMMEASPATPLVMAEPEFLFEFLIVALDAPAQFGGADERCERSVGGESGEPVFERLGIALGAFDQ